MKRNILTAVVLSLFFISCSATKEITINEKCYEKPNPGKCRALFQKYYYNQDEGKCKTFNWGGCGGNIPFHNLKDCQKACEN